MRLLADVALYTASQTGSTSKGRGIEKSLCAFVRRVMRLTENQPVRGDAHLQFVNTLSMDCGRCQIAKCSASSVPAIPEVYRSVVSVLLLPMCLLACPPNVLCLTNMFLLFDHAFSATYAQRTKENHDTRNGCTRSDLVVRTIFILTDHRQLHVANSKRDPMICRTQLRKNERSPFSRLCYMRMKIIWLLITNATLLHLLYATSVDALL